MSGQIFLYSSGGRTLWVPRHTPSPTETKPVCMLNFVTPMELSRSFYLFDYPVQVVESAQMAAMNPNAKTPNEVLAAVNDFRRVCAEDQSFLLQRCYNPQQQQQQQTQPHQPSPQPQQQQHNYQGNYPQAMPSSSMGGGAQGFGGGFDANKPAGNTMDNAALLAQLLQQQRQQQQQQQQPAMPMMGGGRSGSYPDMSNPGSAYGGSYGDDANNNNGGYYRGGRGGRRGGMYNNNTNMPYMPDMMQQQQQQMPMMGGGYNNANFGMMDSGMMYGHNNSGMPYQRGGRGGGRRDGQMYGNYGNPMMMPQQQQMMMMGGGGRRGGMGGSEQSSQSRLAPNARHEPEPITIDVAIPEEIKNVYMNASQQLVIATMPGPHMTVWLREHPIPTDTQDKKYVFGKKGLILMLKAAFEEVKDSKPVELFPKQICTHYFIYGYCSRANCFHEHHNEEQLRELIAARHVQLKAMTKAQRHQLIAEIEEKDKAGLAAVEAYREEREKRRAEAAAEREARRQQRQQMRDPMHHQQPMQQQQQQGSLSQTASQPNPSQDIISDNEDETTTLGGQTQSLAELVSGASQDLEVQASGEAAKTPASDSIAKLGITDSDDEENADGDDASSSSAAESRASTASEESSSDADEEEDNDEEEAEEAEEEAEAEEKDTKAKKPAAKKRGRAPAPKKAAKRAKK